ncbi:thiamine pyrophosphate-dependent enzyme, partial [Arthrospira platensis SPKY1]|nr:thiamine pyrophosphate-dependent enzyme [Arthrospira platensis SPKY1]
MRGHEEASGTKYVPQSLMDEWAQRDPIANYEAYLTEQGVLNATAVKSLRANHQKAINTGLAQAFQAPPVEAVLETELADVYTPHEHVPAEPIGSSKDLRF